MRAAWITGAAGLIGSCIARAAPANWKACPLTRSDLELTDFVAVQSSFKRDKPDLVIHCAALSKTLECERDSQRARRNNVEVTRVLCELAGDIPLLFFSTDLVFDGTKGNYTENDPPHPLTVYAETKVAAEQLVLGNPKHTVIRTSINAGRTRDGTAFNEQWRAAWRRGETLNLFADEFRSPIAAEVTARAVWELIEANEPGLYHLAGRERLSRHDLGKLLAAVDADEPDAAARITPGSIRDYAAMRRSPDTSLNCGKAQRLLSFPLPKFSAWLAAHPRAFEP